MNRRAGMDSHDYDVAHFELMIALAKHLRAIPAELLEHEYHHSAFGSWWSMVRCRGRIFRIAFDGKEGFVTLEQQTANASTQPWMELCSLAVGSGELELGLREVVAHLRAV